MTFELCEGWSPLRIVLLGSYADAVSRLGDPFARVARPAKVHQIFRGVVAFVAGHVIDIHVLTVRAKCADLPAGWRVAVRAVPLRAVGDVAGLHRAPGRV